MKKADYTGFVSWFSSQTDKNAIYDILFYKEKGGNYSV